MHHELVLQALQALQTDINTLLSRLTQPLATIRDFEPDQDENEGHLDVTEGISINVWKPAFSNRMQYRAYEKETDLCSNATDPKMAVEAVLYKIVERMVTKMYDDRIEKIDISTDEGLRKLYKEMGMDLDAAVAEEEAKATAEKEASEEPAPE